MTVTPLMDYLSLVPLLSLHHCQPILFAAALASQPCGQIVSSPRCHPRASRDEDTRSTTGGVARPARLYAHAHIHTRTFDWRTGTQEVVKYKYLKRNVQKYKCNVVKMAPKLSKSKDIVLKYNFGKSYSCE